MIFGFTNSVETQYLSVAPYDLRKDFYQLIDNEINHVKDGHKGLIIAKMNALVDKGMIDKLYEASQAGVKIKLIVRGICTLVPNQKGLSENIEVISIIGEFLEHSRIYYFQNHRDPKVFIASADWMTRNLNRRIEIMFPVLEESIAKRIKAILDLYLKDNNKSWSLHKKGHYTKKENNDDTICSHELLKSLEYDSHDSFVTELHNKLKK
jgi:polyphosphate kinase